MKLWISKNSGVSVIEQIVTQVRVGVAGGDLGTGQRLPSTREIARRFQIHANTVAAAYRQLADEGLIELRKGSGMYVSDRAPVVDGKPDLDSLVEQLVRKASAEGYCRADIEAALRRWLDRDGVKSVAVIEPDEGLRAILLYEITAATGHSAVGTDIGQLASIAGNAAIAALYDERSKVEHLLPPGKEAIFLEVNSVAASLAGAGRPDVDGPIAVVSCWEQFLSFARVYLLAAQLDSDMLMIRSTMEPGWDRGLSSAALVICDSHTAAKLGPSDRLRVFELLRPDSIEKLKNALL